MDNCPFYLRKGIFIFADNKKKNFVFAYCDNPDGILHKTGCHSPETKEFIKMAENRVEQLIDELRETNTLLIISADHGHNDRFQHHNILHMFRGSYNHKP